MPCTIVSLVIGSCSSVRVGSSSTSLTSAAFTFSSSALILAPTAALYVCSGYSIGGGAEGRCRQGDEWGRRVDRGSLGTGPNPAPTPVAGPHDSPFGGP